MSSTPEKQARAEAMLGELAELGLMVARELAVRLRESEDVAETVALADAFQKMSRTVRLTLALDAKLDRDAARDAKADAQAQAETQAAEQRQAESARYAEQRRNPHPVEVRQQRVRGLLNRLLWNESEGDAEDFEVLTDDLTARLDEAALSPDFEVLPIETLARRVLADMGLSGELTLSLGEAPAGEPTAQPPSTDTG